MRNRSGSRIIIALLVAALLLASGSAPAAAAEENKILTIAKDAVYGSATGLFLGAVLALVVKAEDRGDVVRWGVVIGTFTGFSYGIYDARRGVDEFSMDRTGPAHPQSLRPQSLRPQSLRRPPVGPGARDPEGSPRCLLPMSDPVYRASAARLPSTFLGRIPW